MTLLAALFALGCSGPDVPAPTPGGLSLVYSGNVDGEIEPCG
jgi:hypothetical protein